MYIRSCVEVADDFHARLVFITSKWIVKGFRPSKKLEVMFDCMIRKFVMGRKLINL